MPEADERGPGASAPAPQDGEPEPTPRRRPAPSAVESAAVPAPRGRSVPRRPLREVEPPPLPERLAGRHVPHAPPAETVRAPTGRAPTRLPRPVEREAPPPPSRSAVIGVEPPRRPRAMSTVARPPVLPAELAEYRLTSPLVALGAIVVGEAESRSGLPVRLRFFDPERAGVERAFSAAQIEGETEIAERLAHPGLPRLFDAGPTAAGGRYLVYERSLGEPIERLSPAPIERVAAWIRALAEALGHLHAHRIALRNVRAAAVVVAGGELPSFVDLSLAGGFDAPIHPSIEAESGPPEAARGDYGAAGDQFMLGRLLEALLAGREAGPLGDVVATATRAEVELRYPGCFELSWAITRARREELRSP